MYINITSPGGFYLFFLIFSSSYVDYPISGELTADCIVRLVKNAVFMIESKGYLGSY